MDNTAADMKKKTRAASTQPRTASRTPAVRLSPQLGVTIPAALLKFIDEIDATATLAAIRAGDRTRLGRSGALRGIVEGVRRLGLDFSNATTDEEIAATIANRKR